MPTNQSICIDENKEEEKNLVLWIQIQPSLYCYPAQPIQPHSKPKLMKNMNKVQKPQLSWFLLEEAKISWSADFGII